MLTSTSLNHPTTQRNLFTSIHRSVRLSKRNGQCGIVYMKNAKGENFLRVTHYRGMGFKFHTQNQEITNKVLTSLKQGVNIDSLNK